MRDRIRVLVVEDSPTVREFLVGAFDAEPDMRAVAAAADGLAAVEAARTLRPDVVTMDVNMPWMDGLDATRRIMRECPAPIVIVSGVLGDEVGATFRAVEAGALAFVRTPAGPADAALPALVETVRLMAGVRVVRRSRRRPAGGALAPIRPTRLGKIDAVAIGASTGGPVAIRDLLCALGQEFHPPVLIVQHIAPGFARGLCDWLRETTGRAVRLAVDDEPFLPERVYVAPDGRHLGVTESGRMALSDDAPLHGLRPAVSYLFRAVRQAYGARAAAVLLSGMGKDGAQELLELRNAGALTFAQSSDSATVFGMPGEAIRLDAARHVLSPAEIGAALSGIAR